MSEKKERRSLILYGWADKFNVCSNVIEDVYLKYRLKGMSDAFRISANKVCEWENDLEAIKEDSKPPAEEA